MNLFFVRHAQSTANIDAKVLRSATNMSIGLSEAGLKQAQETGAFLAKNLIGSTKIWNSPYNRTRQTANFIKNSLGESNISFQEEESIYISERQFGLVDDVAEYRRHYPHEVNHWMMHKNHKHEFFARPPLGESGFDMCLRLDFFLKQCVPLDNHIENHIIVSHGAAIRGLLMMNQKWEYEKFTTENPYNASVTKVENGILKGVVFTPSVLTK